MCLRTLDNMQNKLKTTITLYILGNGFLIFPNNKDYLMPPHSTPVPELNTVSTPGHLVPQYL